MEWFEELDFYENPFSVHPKKFLNQLVGVEQVLNDLFYRVESGSMVFIEGGAGLGKTSLLRRIINKFRGKKRVIYFDCREIDSKANINELMQRRYGFFGKLLKLTPKNVILLLDNVALSKKNAERVKFYFDEGYIKSVIFAGKSYSSVALPQSLKERIGARVVKLKAPTAEEAVEIVRKRIGDTIFADDALIKKIYKYSGKNTKRFLENCEKIAKKVVKAKRDKADYSDLKTTGGKRG
jgi:chromosomal replication initiation ATPase DnaA